MGKLLHLGVVLLLLVVAPTDAFIRRRRRCGGKFTGSNFTDEKPFRLFLPFFCSSTFFFLFCCSFSRLSFLCTQKSATTHPFLAALLFNIMYRLHVLRHDSSHPFLCLVHWMIDWLRAQSHFFRRKKQEKKGGRKKIKEIWLLLYSKYALHS